jgi:1,4-alpha-glucan branching enzyme
MRPAYRSITKHTTFRLNAPEAKEVRVLVCLINNDDAKPVTRALHKGLDGVWSLRMELARGRYVYHFLLDGTPTLDPAARIEVEDEQGGKWSMREIGH